MSDDVNAKETLLEKLQAHGGLCRLDRRKLAAIELSKAKRILVIDLAGDLYACLAPMPELARLQLKLARLKLDYQASPTTAGRDDKFLQVEIQIAREFRAIGCQPSYPTGFGGFA